MIERSDNNPGKSKIWQSLKKEIQTEIIALTDKRRNAGSNETTLAEEELCRVIHETLGCTPPHGAYSSSFEHLENLSKGDGPLFHTIKEYVNKFQIIKAAAFNISKHKEFTEQRSV